MDIYETKKRKVEEKPAPRILDESLKKYLETQQELAQIIFTLFAKIDGIEKLLSNPLLNNQK